MSSDEAQNSSDSESTCVVCFKTVEIYSVGVCDHPVCFECSTRMRVLCKQNECPICRQDMPQVIFTKQVQPYCALSQGSVRSHLQDRKWGILFCNPGIQRSYYKLLEHNCNVCNSKEKRAFKTFHQLKEHMRKEHELFFCDLCVDNLKIFTFERKCYTRKELAQHRRKGDVDNTSHRGHPLCEFCDTRYVDSDELFRHLRREHLFCHLCDADGRHEFYNTYEDLRNHFLEKHYLCEEGDCRNNMLTSVFRSDIDLKAHFTSVHGRYLSKSATRQARMLELEFTLTPRQRLDNAQNVTGRHRRHGDEDVGLVNSDSDFEPVRRTQSEHPFVNTLSADNFPTLGNNSEVPRPVTSVTFSKIRSNEPFRGEDFPVLGGNSVPNGRTNRNSDDNGSKNNKNPEVTITRSIRGRHGFDAKNTKDFPALGEPSTSAGPSQIRLSVNSTSSVTNHVPNLSIQVQHKPNGAISTSIRASSDAFPALGTTVSVPEAQWVKKTEPKPVAQKVAAAPSLPPSSLAEFPSLQAKKKGKKTANVTMPVREESWVNLNNLKGEGDKKSTKNEAKVSDESSSTETAETKTKNKKKKSKNTNTEAKGSQPLNGLTKKRSELNIAPLNKPESAAMPPGFHVKPPPGFETPPVVGNNLTFTNSTGRSYVIRPITRYIQPDNFAARNRNLIEKLMGIVKDNGMIREFKSYSDLFRNGTLPAERFYEHCTVLLSDKFNDFFSELLVLLPDIEKQQALFKVHEKFGNLGNLTVCEECKQVVLKQEKDCHELYHTKD